MARPCTCDQGIDRPWQPGTGQCSRCWLWHNKPETRAALEGSMPPPPGAPAKPAVPCGDLFAAVARYVGADRLARLWEKWTGKPCGCPERQAAMNKACAALEKWLRRLSWLKGG